MLHQRTLPILAVALCSVCEPAYAQQPSDAALSNPEPMTSHAMATDDYPLESLRNHEQGQVRIEFVVGTDGTVDDCRVVRSSGIPRLDDAACTMVKRKWKYRPATQDGKPVRAMQIVNVNFVLKGGCEGEGFFARLLDSSCK